MEGKDRLTDIRIVFLLALLCCFLWGSATPAIKIGYIAFSIAASDTASIILFAGIRFFTAGALVILFQSILTRHFVRPDKAALPSIAILAAAQTAIQYFCFYIGVAHTSGVAGTIATGTGGFFTILLAALIFRSEKMTRQKIIGCLLGFGGVVAMNIRFGSSIGTGFSMLGEGMVLLAQISYAASGNIMKKFSSRFPVAMLSGYQFMLGGLVLAAAGYAAGGRIAAVSSLPDLLLLAYLAMISSVAYTVWGILMQHNPVSRVAIFSFLTPLSGVLLSAVFLGEAAEALSAGNMLALLLVSLGIWTVNRRSVG